MSEETILLITDSHIGARSGSRYFRQYFREYLLDVLIPFIEENNIKTVLHGGDFFDNRSSLSLSDIDFVINEFIPAFRQTGAHMTMVAGNHDVAYRNTNRINSLSIFKAHSDIFTVLDDDIGLIKTSGSKNFVMCPWMNDENRDKLVEQMSFYNDDDHILFGHFEFANMRMHKNSKLSDHGYEGNEKFLNNYHQILSGHFHHPSNQGNICYLGALFPTVWQDHDDWRGFWTYEPSSDNYQSHSNEYSLFTELNYQSDDLVNIEDSKLHDLCEGQIVRVVIDQNTDYSKVDLKDVIHRIESQKPISVDILDNSVIDFNSGDDSGNVEDDESLVSTRDSLRDYAESFFENDSQMLELFDEVKQSAESKMKEVE